MSKAIYAGSFDCITHGHTWMAQEGSKLFDGLIVLVANNADKKHMLSFDERLKLARDIFKPLNKNIAVEGMEKEFVVSSAKRHGANYLLRGIRSNLDYEYESQIANINSDLAEGSSITSVFLMPPSEFKAMSSSVVRGLIGFTGWEHAIEKYVPQVMADEIYYRHSDSANLRVDYLLKKYKMKITGADIMEHYNRSDRHYHNWQHIEECIREFVRVKQFAQNPDAVEMAIYFHDVIYNTKNADSEDNSAIFFENLAQGASFDFRHEVYGLIKGTKWLGNEYPIQWTPDLKLLHDIDFGIFASTTERFKEYDDQIRKEYSYVPDEIFKQHRVTF